MLGRLHKKVQEIAVRGHTACADCYDRTIHQGCCRCTLSWRSATAHRVPFVPEEEHAAAAAAMFDYDAYVFRGF